MKKSNRAVPANLAVGSDERRPLTDFVVSWLKTEGFNVELFGALKGENLSWVEVGQKVAEKVASVTAMKGYFFAGRVLG